MSTYVRTTTVDSAPSGDSVKQAILDLDTDLTGHIAAYNTHVAAYNAHVAAYNAHDTATTSVHGFTGTKTGSGAMVGATSPTLVTPVISGHCTIEGVTPTGATGTGKFVFDKSPTIATPTLTTPTVSGHATIEGVTLTGATGTGNLVCSISPTITAPTLETPVFTGTITNASGTIAKITGTISETENAAHSHLGYDVSMYNYTIDAGITNSGWLCGIRSSAYIKTETFCGTLAMQMGLYGRAGIYSCGVGGTINTAYGGRFDILNADADGTITTAYGVYITNADVTGTMTNRYGLGVAAMAGTGTLAAGINIGALSGTQTTKCGITLGAISGASTTNYGIQIGNVSGGTKNYSIYTGTGDVMFGGLVNTTVHYEVDGKQVVSNRVVDARCDDTINTSAWDSTTAGVLDSLRDAMITHGLIAAS